MRSSRYGCETEGSLRRVGMMKNDEPHSGCCERVGYRSPN
jgi:hypothetical protein